MMDAVRDDHVPEDRANRDLPPMEERHCAIEILGLQLFNPRHGFLVYALVAGRERFNGARPLDVRRLAAEVELPASTPRLM